MSKETYIKGVARITDQSIRQTAWQVDGLVENDVIQAHMITDQEISLTTTNSFVRFSLVGKNVRVLLEKNGAITETKYGDVESLALFSVQGTTGAVVRIKGYITEFSCVSNLLTSLDVTKATALKILRCSYNQLTELDVTKCTQLTWLECYSNQLTSLDVSKCTKLTRLECYENNITSLDVTKCTELTFLDCADNAELTALDVTKCTKLKHLDVLNDDLTSMDVSKCTQLTYLYLSGNQLTELYFPVFDGSAELLISEADLYDPEDEESIRAFLDSLPKQKPYTDDQYVDLYMGEEFEDEDVQATWNAYIKESKGYGIFGEY